MLLTLTVLTLRTLAMPFPTSLRLLSHPPLLLLLLLLLLSCSFCQCCLPASGRHVKGGVGW
eukprot:2870098-Rhodomonas_salina.1